MYKNWPLPLWIGPKWVSETPPPQVDDYIDGSSTSWTGSKWVAYLCGQTLIISTCIVTLHRPKMGLQSSGIGRVSRDSHFRPQKAQK